MESVKTNLGKNNPIVHRLQLTTQRSTGQTEVAARGNKHAVLWKPLTVALISNISISSFQLKLCNNYICEKLHVNAYCESRSKKQ